MLNVRLAGDHLHWEIPVHLAVAGDVFDGVFLCCPFSPLDVSDEIWDLIESVSEGFPTYSFEVKVFQTSRPSPLFSPRVLI